MDPLRIGQLAGENKNNIPDRKRQQYVTSNI